MLNRSKRLLQHKNPKWYKTMQYTTTIKYSRYKLEKLHVKRQKSYEDSSTEKKNYYCQSVYLCVLDLVGSPVQVRGLL